jgi:outer membrane protein OmpA-like peptidoglycan-associated protein
MPSKNGEEEFALFPFSNDKMAYVTNAIEGDFLSPKEGRTGGNFYRVMICDAAKMDDRDEEAQVFKEIQNGKYHWGPVYFSKSGQKMFITVNEPQKSKEGLARMHQLKLRYFTKLNEGWKEEEFPWNSKEFSTGHATMDTLGRVIFASDRPGGLGGTDLYWTIWEDGHWSTPINLGPTINSKGNEMFPFVSGSGDFYFASDGWPGLGGLDVFAMYNTSVAPENLLPPLNSSSDDFAFWINDANSKGYFSSNRVQDQDQLYSFDLPPYPVHIRIESHYCDNVPYANDTIVLQDLSNEKQLKLLTDENGVVSINGRKNGHYQFQIRKNKYSSGVIQSLKIDQPGNYVVKMQPQLSDQTIVFNIFNDKSKPIAGALVELFKQGAKKPKRKILSPENGKVSILKSELLDLDSVHISFINHSDFNWHKVKLSCEDTLEVPVQLKIFKREDFVNLDLILYDYGKYNLRPESKVELDKLVSYMKKHPGMKVELSSHTDSRSPFDFNEKLSQNRSNSCVQYIISKGIDPSLIIAKGYGEYKLKNRCKDGVPCSEAEHQENRRTELHILLNEGD